jgi:flagellar hook protein FlgE
MSALDSALSGIQSATASFNASAAKIASSRSDADLATAVTSTLTDKTAFQADAKVAQTANDMQKRLLDVKV